MGRYIKNYGGHLYVKGHLQEILKTSEIDYVESSDSILLFPTNISLKRARDTLEVIKAGFDDRIAKEEEENNERDSKK